MGIRLLVFTLLINLGESIVLLGRDIALALTQPKYLFRDPVDYQAPKFREVVTQMQVEVVGRGGEWDVTTDYGEQQRVTRVLLVNGYDMSKPSLIYHHGAGSSKPLRDFEIIFGRETKEKFNVFVVWAAGHRSKQEYLNTSVDSFEHHLQTFVGSVRAYEEVIKYHRTRSDKVVVATGSSMGGIVASWHAFVYGSADYYYPLVAYPNAGEIFLSRAYKYAVSNFAAKQQNSSYFASFEVGAYDEKLREKVFPVIGTADKVIGAEKAIKFWEREGFKVTKYPYGHFTPAVMRGEIRKMIISKVNNK